MCAHQVLRTPPLIYPSKSPEQRVESHFGCIIHNSPMKLNADLAQRACINMHDLAWEDSPSSGVQRLRLERDDDKPPVERVTTIVRFAPGSSFSGHVHGGGEEFFVLEGEFGDEHDRYPRGTYVRNPIGTAHSPRVGPEGCVIFVKLQQFEKEDQAQFATDTTTANFQPGAADGIEILRLHVLSPIRFCLTTFLLDLGWPVHHAASIARLLTISGPASLKIRLAWICMSVTSRTGNPEVTLCRISRHRRTSS